RPAPSRTGSPTAAALRSATVSYVRHRLPAPELRFPPGDRLPAWWPGDGGPRQQAGSQSLTAGCLCGLAAAQRGQLLLDLGGVLLLRHADRALHPPVQELPDHRLVAGQQLLPRPEHDQLAAEEQPDVVRYLAGGGDVVRD